VWKNVEFIKEHGTIGKIINLFSRKLEKYCLKCQKYKVNQKNQFLSIEPKS
jgi:hypothetical protein